MYPVSHRIRWYRSPVLPYQAGVRFWSQIFQQEALLSTVFQRQTAPKKCFPMSNCPPSDGDCHSHLSRPGKVRVLWQEVPPKANLEPEPKKGSDGHPVMAQLGMAEIGMAEIGMAQLFGSLRWSCASFGHPMPWSAWTGHPPPGEPRFALWWLTLQRSAPLVPQWQQTKGAVGALLGQAGLGARGP